MTRVEKIYAIVLEYTLYFELSAEQSAELLLAILKYDILGKKEEIKSSIVKIIYDDYIKKTEGNEILLKLEK